MVPQRHASNIRLHPQTCHVVANEKTIAEQVKIVLPPVSMVSDNFNTINTLESTKAKVSTMYTGNSHPAEVIFTHKKLLMSRRPHINRMEERMPEVPLSTAE